jgi:hypothetical protein
MQREKKAKGLETGIHGEMEERKKMLMEFKQ